MADSKVNIPKSSNIARSSMDYVVHYDLMNDVKICHGTISVKLKVISVTLQTV